MPTLTASSILSANSKIKLPSAAELQRDALGIPYDQGDALLELNAAFAIQGETDAAPLSGKVLLFPSYLAFFTLDKRTLRVVVPLYVIRRVEKFAGNVSGGAFALSLVVWHGMKLTLYLQATRATCDSFCAHLKTQLVDAFGSMKQLKQFTATCYSESLIEQRLDDGSGDEAEDTADVDVANSTVHQGLGGHYGYPGDAKKLREKSKVRLWKDYFQSHGRNLTLVKNLQCVRLVQVGLPNRLRGEMWEVLSGSIYLRFTRPGLYQKILEDHKGQTSLATEEIEKDLHRSMPDYPGYQADGSGIASLRNVLTAYSWQNKELGYCQAMNIVVAAVLIYMSEEQAFHLLEVLATKILPGYWTISMHNTLLDQRVFDSLLHRLIPMVSEHLKRYEIQTGMATLPWFLSLYIGVMPLVFAMRVVDCFLASGPRVLFQVGLAIMKINGEAILSATDDGMVLSILREYFSKLGDSVDGSHIDSRVRNITNFQELLVTAFREFNFVTDDFIASERRRYRDETIKSIETFAKRNILRNIKLDSNLTKEQAAIVYDHFVAAASTASNTCKGTESPLTRADGAPMSTSSQHIVDPITNRIENVLDFEAFKLFFASIVTWARDEIIVKNAFVERLERKIAPNDGGLFRRIFLNWAESKDDLISLQECADGIARRLRTDVVSSTEWFYSLYTDEQGGSLDKDDILRLSEALLFIFRSEEGDGYLAAVSKFLTDAMVCAQEENNEEPRLTLAAFRMIVLANDLLASFFEVDLAASMQLKPLIDEVIVPLAGRKGALGFVGGLLNQFVTEEHRNVFNRFTDDIGKTLGQHQQVLKPSIGKGAVEIGDTSVEEAKLSSRRASNASPNTASSMRLNLPGIDQLKSPNLKSPDSPISARSVMDPRVIATRLLQEREAFAVDEVNQVISDDEVDQSGITENIDNDDVLNEVEAFLLANE